MRQRQTMMLRDRIRKVKPESKVAAHSMASLVGIALQDRGSERGWQAIHDLRMRGGHDALVLIERLANSRNWRKRELGLQIAGQLR